MALRVEKFRLRSNRLGTNEVFLRKGRFGFLGQLTVLSTGWWAAKSPLGARVGPAEGFKTQHEGCEALLTAFTAAKAVAKTDV